VWGFRVRLIRRQGLVGARMPARPARPDADDKVWFSARRLSAGGVAKGGGLRVAALLRGAVVAWILAIVVLGGAAWPAAGASRAESVGQGKDLLRRLFDDEEVYFTEHRTYTSRRDALIAVDPLVARDVFVVSATSTTFRVRVRVGLRSVFEIELSRAGVAVRTCSPARTSDCQSGVWR
jgi:hypothetical protein